jgi:hypothetical protein
MPSGSGGAPGGSTIPHSPIRAPPTGSSGRGSGSGAEAPGSGTSERSSGGGGVAWYRQPDVPGLATGGGGKAGCASAGPAAVTAVSATSRTATARAAATRDGDRRIKTTG